MSAPIERTVTFSEPTTLNNGSYHLVRFVITPPIAVHDSKFLERAIEDSPGNRYAFGDFDLTDGVVVSYSDENGTYGFMRVHRGVSTDTTQEVVTTAFRPELELGNTVLHFSFPE